VSQHHIPLTDAANSFSPIPIFAKINLALSRLGKNAVNIEVRKRAVSRMRIISSKLLDGNTGIHDLEITKDALST